MKRFVTVLLALLLAACTASDAPAAPSLAGTAWTLQSIGGAPLGKTQRPPSLRFMSETQVGGHGGCNSCGGSYELKGNVIKFGQLHTTLMACEHGMDIESQFHAMLKGVRTVTVTGGALILHDEGGAEVARAPRLRTAAIPPSREKPLSNS